MSNDKEKTGFYVEPKLDCPHIRENVKVEDPATVADNKPCESCQHADENWVCLTCRKRFCSRYVQGHMQSHNDSSKHPIVASYSDLSVWCYDCESYISHPSLKSILSSMSVSKFGGGSTGTGGRFTSHKTNKQMEEIYDTEDELKKKIKSLAELIRNSKYMTAFTGAGISTSAGIPDFRGPQGVWTLKATNGIRTDPTTPTLSAVPTPTHMALVGLQNVGILKYLISQNVDGLHRRSGIKPGNISELHGNTNLETCEKCGREYMRDFSTCERSTVGHYTGRRCTSAKCDGQLQDTIINFGEQLPLHCVSNGFDQTDKSDLCLSLGSSLTVTPAATMPKNVGKKKGGNLVIVNLQRTPLDEYSSLRIFAKTDEVMVMLMKELGYEIPDFRLQRVIRVKKEKKSESTEVTVSAVDVDGTPLSLFRGVEGTWVDQNKNSIGSPIQIDMDQSTPYSFSTSDKAASGIELKMFFMGHYNEPSFTIVETLAFDGKEEEVSGKRLEVSFNPMKDKEWKVDSEEKLTKDKMEKDAEIAEQKELDPDKYPSTINDPRHKEHALKLTNDVYENTPNQGAYRCNSCMQIGMAWVYHCSICQYDLHPSCAVWRRNFKD